MADTPKMPPPIRTEIDQGWFARLKSGTRYALTGKSPDWFGPGDPMQPSAQEAAHGRQFDYPSAFNLSVRPRNNEPVDFATLRSLADSWGILRLAVETRKDQMAKLKWHISPRDESKAVDARSKKIHDFLQYPDKINTWDSWIRILVEDLLVIDAPTIYPQMSKGGELYALQVMDGGTIKPIIDASGRMPMPPDPAYAQILKGLPATYYTADELLYQPRNKRSWKVYGYSPVEQVIITINIALRREVSQLQYYTEGNIPEALISVPTTWNPDQIRAMQSIWDQMMSGDTAERRKMKFVPGGMDAKLLREPELKGEYDEWLARIVCYAFSLEPTPFVKQMNRAVAETVRQQALEEGLLPMQKHIKSLHDLILTKYFQAPDLEFAWDEEESIDPLVQAQINRIYLGPTAVVLRPNEVRETLGLAADPALDEEADPLVLPGQPAGADQAGAQAQVDAAAKIAKRKKKVSSHYRVTGGY